MLNSVNASKLQMGPGQFSVYVHLCPLLNGSVDLKPANPGNIWGAYLKIPKLGI